MKYIVRLNSTNKAKNDVDDILLANGFRSVSSMAGDKSSGISRFFAKVWAVIKIVFTLHKGDVLFLQYPMKKFFALACRMAHLRGAKVITLIHDLGTFRRHKLKASEEISLLSQSDAIIVHNPSMLKWLSDNGYSNPMVVLGIFDYLTRAQPMQRSSHSSPWNVIFASGLGPHRSKFIYELDPHVANWRLSLFGRGMDPADAAPWQHINLHGFVKSDDLVASNDADFALVWDGESIDQCIGDWGSYLAINNPHKTSFAFCCGLPVIIWDKAALAPFVIQHKAGIAVSSLRDVNEALANLSDDDYALMRANAHRIGCQLRDGHYVLQAFHNAAEAIGC